MTEFSFTKECARAGCDNLFASTSTTPHKIYCTVFCRTMAERERRKVDPSLDELELDVDHVDDLESLLAERGMKLEDWTVVRVTVNKWEGFHKDDTGEAVTVPLKQLKVYLRPKFSGAALIQPASPLPTLLQKLGRAKSKNLFKRFFIYGDDQRPNVNKEFEVLKLKFLAENDFDEIIDLGDGMDMPTISKYKTNPAASWSVQDCANNYASWLFALREVQPDARIRILADNHITQRLRDYQLSQAEALYGVTPATVPGLEDDLKPLWSLERLLRLDELKIEYVAPPNDTHYAESHVELIPGELAVIHGYRTGANLGKKFIDDYGCSVIYGHQHAQDVYVTDHRRRGVGKRKRYFGIGVGCGAEIKGGGGYAPGADWQNNALVVTLFPDEQWTWDYVNYADGVLTWRDQHYAL